PVHFRLSGISLSHMAWFELCQRSGASTFFKGTRRSRLNVVGSTTSAVLSSRRTPWSARFRSDSRPRLSFSWKIAVRTTTDSLRTNQAGPMHLFIRKSLKINQTTTAKRDFFTNLPFAAHLYRPGSGPETSFFTHQL